MKQYLRQLLIGQALTATEIQHIVRQIQHGQVSEVWLASWLSLWAARGETPAEIVALVKGLRQSLPRVTLSPGLGTVVDLVGTGGDGKNTLNISTVAALVTASCGIPVAKHGNHSSSSQCGSADLLDQWGIQFRGSLAQAEQCLQQCGICFCYARQHNPVMARLAPIRKELGIRTCFNVIGPLLNPMPVNTMLVGVYSPTWLLPMAHLLRDLGVTRGMVVHSGGMDEATTTASTEYCEISPAKSDLIVATLEPGDLGFSMGNPSDLVGGDPQFNATQLTDLLTDTLTHNGNRTVRETLALNAGIAIYLADKVSSLQEGCALAWKAIESGRAGQLLQRWRETSVSIYT